MFNQEQREHMAELSSYPLVGLCWCGWYKLGECPNCPKGKTAADKAAAWCPECHGAPSPDGSYPVSHLKGCSLK